MIRALLKKRRYQTLKDFLSTTSAGDIAALWMPLEPMEKLAAFKLLDGAKAMALYGRLSFEERYFLFCGFPLETLAPILEDMSEKDKKIFRRPSPKLYQKMLQQVSA